MFSRLTVGFPSPQRRHPEVLERTVIGRSPILLTPFEANWDIDLDTIAAFVDAAFANQGLTPDAVDTGAVIITGEAARRDNARRIAEHFSSLAGRFVCATAGPHLEEVLAAHGSGAASRSRDAGSTLLHIDVGGGTTKIGVIHRGRVASTSALNIGARLIAYDETGRLVRTERAGRQFLRHLGYDLEAGDTVSEELLSRLASLMVDVLFGALAGEPPPWEGLFVTARPSVPARLSGIVFSGGVADYIYGRESATYGDLGPVLGTAVRKRAEQAGYRILPAEAGIRATVIGASEYSVQMSGETIFIPDPTSLPLRNLRTFVAHTNWEAPIAQRAASDIQRTLAARDPEVVGTAFALVVASPPFIGYGAAQELGEGLRAALSAMPAEERPKLLIFEQNIGQIVGQNLASALRLPCIDEISLSELDFIDVGRHVDGEAYVPVVVKSLAFGV